MRNFVSGVFLLNNLKICGILTFTDYSFILINNKVILMKHGFIKCAAISPDITVANISANTVNIIEALRDAAGNGVHLAVLPELCITGATCGDLFETDTLLTSALSALKEIAEATADTETLSVLGLPIKYNYKIYNCAAVIHSGEILGIVPKTNLTYDDRRYFTSAEILGGEYGTLKIGEDFAPFSTRLIFRHNEIDTFRLGVQIGTDLFAYRNTAVEACLAGATIIANCAAINYTPENFIKLMNLPSAVSMQLHCGYVFANAGDGESSTDLVFSGQNMITENGEILEDCFPFINLGSIISEVDTELMARLRADSDIPRPEGYTDILFFSEPTETELTRPIVTAPFEKISNRLVLYSDTLTGAAYGLVKRIKHTHAQKLVLGISGGLDSTLALLTCVKALDHIQRPHTDIIAVTMPCFGTSNRTKSNAEKLCEELGVTLKYIDIKDAVSQHFKDIGHNENDMNVTFENAQARERTQILMDIANDVGGLVIGTGDLSELALGFATYNGDQMSMYAVNASIPKTLIRSLIKYYSRGASREVCDILDDILDTPVSPELLPGENGEIGQITEDLVGPYELHDFFIYHMIKNGFSPQKIYRLALIAFKDVYDGATILKWLKVFTRRFFSQQFKRSCMPDGPQVTNVSFSPRGAFKMPSDAVAQEWLNELENL